VLAVPVLDVPELELVVPPVLELLEEVLEPRRASKLFDSA
jgi:hypothetical protein